MLRIPTSGRTSTSMGSGLRTTRAILGAISGLIPSAIPGVTAGWWSCVVGGGLDSLQPVDRTDGENSAKRLLDRD